MDLEGFVRLTWGEFKHLAEDVGANDDTVIEYIDIGGYDLDRPEADPPTSTNIMVRLGKKHLAGRLVVD